MLYAGTPALKGDFTRTGQRTKMGLLQDGTNSAIRYVVNNFQDHRYGESSSLLWVLRQTDVLPPPRVRPRPLFFPHRASVLSASAAREEVDTRMNKTTRLCSFCG